MEGKFKKHANDNQEGFSVKITFASVYFDGDKPYAFFEGGRWDIKLDRKGEPITLRSPRTELSGVPLIHISQKGKKRWVHWRNPSTAVLRANQ